MIYCSEYNEILNAAEESVLEHDQGSYMINKKVEDPISFIKLGFFPSFSVKVDYSYHLFGFDTQTKSMLIFNEFIIELLNNTDDNTLLFWYGCIATRYIKNCNNWECESIESIKNDSIKSG